MSEQTAISWCDATFNPWLGCTAVSPACDSCYARALVQDRLHRVRWGAGQPRQRTKTWGDPVRWNKQPFAECMGCGWRGEQREAVVRCPACGRATLREARRRVFCASLADVFDNEVDPQWRVDLLKLIVATPKLDWLLLTKRIGNARQMLDEAARAWSSGLTDWSSEPPPNVWLGATVVNQDEADRDIPKLLAVPARVRFLSIEPMLSAIRLDWCDLWGASGGPGIDWVIAGGESGPKARPAHPDWFRSLRDQCAAAGVAWHLKQWGEWAPSFIDRNVGSWRVSDSHRWPIEPGDPAGGIWSYRIGKAAAGRTLDGVTHDAFPA